jgi:hypothetical protein
MDQDWRSIDEEARFFSSTYVAVPVSTSLMRTAGNVYLAWSHERCPDVRFSSPMERLPTTQSEAELESRPQILSNLREVNRGPVW